MGKAQKGQRWVFGQEVEGQPVGDGVTRKVCAYCEEMMCAVNEFKTGAVGTLHTHPHTQITYVAKGRFQFTIGGETHEVACGDTLLKQNGVEHGCVCLEEGTLVDFFTPMRKDFVDEE